MYPVTMHSPDAAHPRSVEVFTRTEQDQFTQMGWTLDPDARPDQEFPQLLWRGPFEALEEITVNSESEKAEKLGDGWVEDRPADPNAPVTDDPQGPTARRHAREAGRSEREPTRAERNAALDAGEAPDRPARTGITPAPPQAPAKKKS